MGYELNANAYKILIQIEVGIREFLIDCIKESSVNDWFQNFFGNIQRNNFQEIIERINTAKKKGEFPDIEDQYLVKLNRALKDVKNSYKTNNLFHPFYYLNWTDMESLMRMKTNILLIDGAIGKLNREVITNNLKSITSLRNDIAHSRFISENDYQVIRGSLDQISALIPKFSHYSNNQTLEETPAFLLNTLLDNIQLVESSDRIDINKIEEFILLIDKCSNSFWINSFNKSLIAQIVILQTKMNNYKAFTDQIGGLLMILRWKSENTKFLKEIKKLINEQI